MMTMMMVPILLVNGRCHLGWPVRGGDTLPHTLEAQLTNHNDRIHYSQISGRENVHRRSLGGERVNQIGQGQATQPWTQ